jgi:hypothetical protein
MANGQDVSNNHPLTDVQRDALITRMQTAWANLPDDKQAALKPLVDDAHQQFANYLQTGATPEHRFHPILRMKSYLTNDWDGHVQRLDRPAPAEAIEVKVGPGGEILGTGRYQFLTRCGSWWQGQYGLRIYSTSIPFLRAPRRPFRFPTR